MERYEALVDERDALADALGKAHERVERNSQMHQEAEVLMAEEIERLRQQLAGAVADLDEALRLLNDARPDYVDPVLRRKWARKRKALLDRHPRGR